MDNKWLYLGLAGVAAYLLFGSKRTSNPAEGSGRRLSAPGAEDDNARLLGIHAALARRRRLSEASQQYLKSKKLAYEVKRGRGVVSPADRFEALVHDSAKYLRAEGHANHYPTPGVHARLYRANFEDRDGVVRQSRKRPQSGFPGYGSNPSEFKDRIKHNYYVEDGNHAPVNAYQIDRRY